MILGASTLGAVAYGGHFSGGRSIQTAHNNFKIQGDGINVRSLGGSGAISISGEGNNSDLRGHGGSISVRGSGGINSSQVSGEF